MSDTRCENCKFWDNSMQHGDRGENGACRIRSPVADDRTGLARWPFVNDVDWCGEFVVHPEVEAMQKEEDIADAKPPQGDEIPF